MALSSEQYFEFIELVHGEELLWNVTSMEFRNSEKKNKVWENVGAKFKITGDEAYKTFKAIRDKYRREKDKEEKGTRSGAGSYRACNWPYMTHLRFLDESHKKRRVYTSPNWEKRSNLGFIDSYNDQTFTDSSVQETPVAEEFPTPFQCQSPSEHQFLFQQPPLKPQTTSHTSISLHTENLSTASSLSSCHLTVPGPSSPLTKSSSPLLYSAPQIRCSSATENAGSKQHSAKPSTSGKRTPSPRNENNLRRACLGNVLTENTSSLVNTLKSVMSQPNRAPTPKPYTNFAEYVRQFMEDIGPEDAKNAEVEILKIILRFKDKKK